MFQNLSSATVVIGALRVNHLDKQTSCVFQEQYMLIHDVIAEFLLTQGDTEVRDYDIGKCITTLTHQIDGEPTPLDIQYSVRFLKCTTTLTQQIDGEPTPLDIQYSVRFLELPYMYHNTYTSDRRETNSS